MQATEQLVIKAERATKELSTRSGTIEERSEMSEMSHVELTRGYCDEAIAAERISQVRGHRKSTVSVDSNLFIPDALFLFCKLFTHTWGVRLGWGLCGWCLREDF